MENISDHMMKVLALIFALLPGCLLVFWWSFTCETPVFFVFRHILTILSVLNFADIVRGWFE